MSREISLYVRKISKHRERHMYRQASEAFAERLRAGVMTVAEAKRRYVPVFVPPVPPIPTRYRLDGGTPSPDPGDPHGRRADELEAPAGAELPQDWTDEQIAEFKAEWDKVTSPGIYEVHRKP